MEPLAADQMRDAVVAAFRERYGGDPDVLVRAPGRVNLMGEHTDYNDGFVLPIAIEPATWLAARRRQDRTVRIASLDFGAGDLDLNHLEPGKGWLDYVAGTLAETRPEVGFDLVVGTSIPIGSGLSSSAALEIGVAMVSSELEGSPWDPVAAALSARRAENDFVGVATGIMDQLAVAVAEPNHALLLDCRSLAYEHIAIGDGATVVICDTGTHRDLVGSGYDDRRHACARAAEVLGLEALRDATIEQVEASSLDPETRERARHVVTENARVHETAGALAAGRWSDVGALMVDSHRSMRDDFEISSPALDAMVSAATEHAGCFGARMTGGGFGGSVVALVGTAAVADFVRQVGAEYRSVTQNEPLVFATRAGAGVEVV